MDSPKEWFIQRLLNSAEPFKSGKLVCKVTAYLWEGETVTFCIYVVEKREKIEKKYLWKIQQLQRSIAEDVETKDVLRHMLDSLKTTVCKWEVAF
jgi:hypothetical protein